MAPNRSKPVSGTIPRVTPFPRLASNWHAAGSAPSLTPALSSSSRLANLSTALTTGWMADAASGTAPCIALAALSHQVDRFITTINSLDLRRAPSLPTEPTVAAADVDAMTAHIWNRMRDARLSVRTRINNANAMGDALPSLDDSADNLFGGALHIPPPSAQITPSRPSARPAASAQHDRKLALSPPKPAPAAPTSSRAPDRKRDSVSPPSMFDVHPAGPPPSQVRATSPCATAEVPVHQAPAHAAPPAPTAAGTPSNSDIEADAQLQAAAAPQPRRRGKGPSGFAEAARANAVPLRSLRSRKKD